MDSDPRLDKWFQEQGGEIKKANRLRSPEGQARAKKAAGIIKQVAAELPGGHENPAFLERIKARLRELYGPGGDGTGASA